jgi:hypothetical protein
MNHLTMQQLHELGFEVEKSGYCDDFRWQRRKHKKHDIWIETTWKISGEFHIQEIKFRNIKNNIEMKKQEKIREAYGEEHWEAVKDYLDENGWCNAFFGIAGLFQHDVIFKKGLIVKWRPKTLAGIENNNGWIKIESEDDLPKDGWHWAKSIIPDNDIWETHYEDFKVGFHTHYQPIVKPQPPIY